MQEVKAVGYARLAEIASGHLRGRAGNRRMQDFTKESTSTSAPAFCASRMLDLAARIQFLVRLLLSTRQLLCQ